MISLDQVRLLEQKVENAVNKIIQLQNENAELREKCAFLESKANNLNQKVSDFESDQNQIEEGIVNALKRLNEVEDAVKSTIELESSVNPEASALDNDSMADEPFNSTSYLTEQTEIQENTPAETQFSPETYSNEEVIDLPKEEIESLGFGDLDFEQSFNESENAQEMNQPANNQFDIF